MENSEILGFDRLSALFLDRDGVINKKPENDYVKSWDSFQFLPGVLQALKLLRHHFERIFIATNQQGIGKGLMTEHQLDLIHKSMLKAIRESGGKIDKIYFCPDLASKPGNCRKPAPYMALQAQKEFPELIFKKSVMVGDTASDMDFGKQLSMKTVLISSTQTFEMKKEGKQPDFVMKDLLSFALLLDNRNKRY
ncbi:MAG: D-glycero-alpha-D-manno-heptose-1,7-bisphosphate 7-phosphatase [Bacteroidota bacterium]